MTIEVARNELLFYRNFNRITCTDGFLYGTGVRA